MSYIPSAATPYAASYGYASPAHHGGYHAAVAPSASVILHAPAPSSYQAAATPVVSTSIVGPQRGSRGDCPCERGEGGCLITAWMDPYHQFVYNHPEREKGARLAVHYKCARGGLGRCPSGDACKIRVADDAHAWQFDHRTIGGSGGSDTKTTATVASVVVLDDNSPVCYVESCTNRSVSHTSTHRHLCPDGRGCTLATHAGYVHPQPCRDNHQCTLANGDGGPSSEQLRIEHTFAQTHPCQLGEACTQTATSHKTRFTHPCARGTICARQSDSVHMALFTHPCPNGGIECKEMTSLIHIAKYHPSEPVLAISASFTSSFASSSSTISKQTIKTAAAVTHSFASTVCSADAKCWQRFSLIDSERCKKHHPSADVIDITSEKASFPNPIVDMKLSPDVTVTVPNGSSGVLKGLQISDSDKCAATGKLVVGFPDKTPAKFKLQAFDEVELKLTSTTLNAPWHHPEVRCFRARRKTGKLRTMLQEDVPGLNGVTYLEFFAELGANSMPAYIVGGAVRDVLQDTKTKDIDMGFGCATKTVGKYALHRGWDVTITGSGLIKLGDPSQKLYLEGKPMNFMNNDTNKFDGGAIRSIGCCFHAENIYGDFTINRLWYDTINDVIWDPTGWGVHDCLAQPPLLRVPVSITALGDRWAAGNPTKLIRYWKMIGRGARPCDDATKQFFIAKMKEYVTSKQLSASAINYFITNTSAADKAAMKTAMIADLGAAFVAASFGALG